MERVVKIKGEDLLEITGQIADVQDRGDGWMISDNNLGSEAFFWEKLPESAMVPKIGDKCITRIGRDARLKEAQIGDELRDCRGGSAKIVSR